MLPTQHRMRRGDEFSAAVRGGARGTSRRLVVHLAATTGGNVRQGTRVGFVVPRAVGGAVRRNTVKRRLRALVGSRLDELPEAALLVVRALPPAAGATSAQLATDLDSALQKAIMKQRRTRGAPVRT